MTLTDNRSTRSCNELTLKEKLCASLNNSPNMSSAYLLRLLSCLIIFAREMLVTHSSSFLMPLGSAVWHKCRGSMFLFTNGILSSATEPAHRETVGGSRRTPSTCFGGCRRSGSALGRHQEPLGSVGLRDGSRAGHWLRRRAAGNAAGGAHCSPEPRCARREIGRAHV